MAALMLRTWHATAGADRGAQGELAQTVMDFGDRSQIKSDQINVGDGDR